MTIQMTIIGMGQIGTSIGLALADHKDRIERKGFDREPRYAQQAQKIGAVDHITHRLEQSVRGADVVVLAVPVDELRETLEIIGLNLHEGAIVIDTTPLSGAISNWAVELLPAGRHYVTMTPSLNPEYLNETATGVDAAHADLFKDGLMIITAVSGTGSEAFKLASDLTEMLGATPLFTDPAEADGLTAAIHLLPQLVAAALLLTTTEQPGWREARKIAGRSYAQATAPLGHMDESLGVGQAAVLNRDNVMRMIDNLIAGLRNLREEISNGDAETLGKQLEQARAIRALWLKDRMSANWTGEEDERSQVFDRGGGLSRMFGFGPKSKKKEDR
jgi:prephenate dehydrogenase